MTQVTQQPSKTKLTMQFDDAIALTGYGKFNLYVLLATGLCLMCVIVETMCMMFIIPAAQCDLNLSLWQKGLLSSISFFGVVSSSHLWGFIADTKGRRNVLIFSLITSSILSFICSLVPWNWLFILLRFLNGFFIGGASAVVYAYAGEFHDNKNRPKIIAFMTTFVAFGNMYLPGLAWIALPQTWSYPMSPIGIAFRPWRLLLIIYALPSLLTAIVLYFLPESPKYLLTQEKYEDVLRILRKMFSVNCNQSEDDFLVKQVIWDELGENVSKKHYGLLKSMWKQTVPLFRGSFLLKTLLVCALQFGIFASNAGVVMWYPEILNKMSHYINDHPNRTVSLCSAILYDEDADLLEFQRSCKDTIKTEVFLVSLIIATAYALCYIFIGSFINIVGKKNLLTGFMVVTTICGLSSQFVNGYNLIQILIGLFLMGGAGIGILNAIVVDLYPTQIRAMALAVSLMFGRFGAMTGSNFVGPLIYNLCDYLFYVVTVDHLLLVIVIVLLPSSQKLAKLEQK